MICYNYINSYKTVYITSILYLYYSAQKTKEKYARLCRIVFWLTSIPNTPHIQAFTQKITHTHPNHTYALLCIEKQTPWTINTDTLLYHAPPCLTNYSVGI